LTNEKKEIKNLKDKDNQFEKLNSSVFNQKIKNEKNNLNKAKILKQLFEKHNSSFQ
jgi:hypothetical protein